MSVPLLTFTVCPPPPPLGVHSLPVPTQGKGGVSSVYICRLFFFIFPHFPLR